MSTDLDAALLEVRKAYRLLEDYQRRMFELLAYIREQLRATPYHQEYILPRPGALGALENDANSGMRYLPMFDLSAFWLRHKGQAEFWDKHRAGDLLFAVWIQSDDGYHSDTFSYRRPVEESRSKLIISAVLCDQPSPVELNWFHGVWHSLPRYSSLMEQVVSSEAAPGYRAWTAAIDLADLGSQEAVDTALDAWRSKASAALGHPV